jgi:Protein of unknown function (DUF1580)
MKKTIKHAATATPPLKKIDPTNAEKAVSRILTESVISMEQARSELYHIVGKRPDKTSLIRWYTRGVGGVKLEAIKLGNSLFTSREALNRFLVARTATIGS